MLQPPVSVVDDVDLRLVVPGDEGLLLTATLRYEASDPYAVEATFRAGEEAISWVLGRDLLSDGLQSECGEGDVHVWPTVEDGHTVVMLQLSSPDGSALLAADADGLEGFLARTYDAVPLGYEGDHLDVDSAIVQLLA
ncbi:SsgA family sporulation/cell division regulator [Angustibacter sp. McL0619]|uniref:SsgA family sporulation/cell division regulator n=1 Tax=Angustibacter sp. McL0619 TaxID=3415676 RepID=UPI003CF77DC0